LGKEKESFNERLCGVPKTLFTLGGFATQAIKDK
jgi:hypothetical protein